MNRLRYEIPPELVDDVIHFLWLAMTSRSNNAKKSRVGNWLVRLEMAVKTNREAERKEQEALDRSQMLMFHDEDVPYLPESTKMIMGRQKERGEKNEGA